MNLARCFFMAGSVILMLSGIGHLHSLFLPPTESPHTVAYAAMKG